MKKNILLYFQEPRDLSCTKCGMMENLIPCDTCHRSYHIHCVEPPLPSIPEGKWSCTKCHVIRFCFVAENDERIHKI